MRRLRETTQKETKVTKIFDRCRASIPLAFECSDISLFLIELIAAADTIPR
jgi:hypothetical protein